MSVMTVKPCPFCGESFVWLNIRTAKLGCTRCNIEVSLMHDIGSMDELVRTWNRRPEVKG